MSKVLVTGGAGFIGSHLVAALVKAGHEVTVVDNLSSAKVLSVNRLQKVRDKVEYVQDDIRNFEVVKKLTEGKDVIFHLAAQSDVQMSIKDPAYDAQVNIFGTLNILRGAQMGKAKRVVFFSSAAIYGDTKKMPIKEELPANPLSPYGLSKYAAEQYCRYFSEYFGLETFALRTFNVYGEGSAGVIYRFIDEIGQNGKINVFGDGKQTRDYLSVHDVVACCLHLVNAKVKSTEKFHVYNLANGKETSLNEIIKVLKQLSKKKFEVNYTTPRAGDIKRSLASIENLKKELKFRPKVTLKDGINELFK